MDLAVPTGPRGSFATGPACTGVLGIPGLSPGHMPGHKPRLPACASPDPDDACSGDELGRGLGRAVGVPHPLPSVRAGGGGGSGSGGTHPGFPDCGTIGGYVHQGEGGETGAAQPPLTVPTQAVVRVGGGGLSGLLAHRPLAAATSAARCAPPAAASPPMASPLGGGSSSGALPGASTATSAMTGRVGSVAATDMVSCRFCDYKAKKVGVVGGEAFWPNPTLINSITPCTPIGWPCAFVSASTLPHSCTIFCFPVC